MDDISLKYLVPVDEKAPLHIHSVTFNSSAFLFGSNLMLLTMLKGGNL